MQHARRVAMGTLALAIAASSAALAADDPEKAPQAGGGQARSGAAAGAAAASPGAPTGATADDTAHHAPAAAPAPPTRAEVDAELSQPAPSADGANWDTRLGRSQIERLQQELSSRGVYHGPIDGLVGPQTRAALQNFQAQQGLPAHARLDARTRHALGLEPEVQPVSGDDASASPGLAPSVGRDTSASAGGSGSAPLKLETLDPQQLGALQTRLAELGFYRGSVDGKLGPGTRAALQHFFQAQAEFASRGMLTEVAASALGVEPGTASAPKGSMGSSEPAATMPHPQPSTP